MIFDRCSTEQLIKFPAEHLTIFRGIPVENHCSIELRSGLFPGHSRKVIFWAIKRSVTTFERWHGAPFCIKIVQSCTDMCSCSFSFIKFKYLWPFIVVPGFKKKSPAVHLIEMASHTVTLGGCFTVSWVYFLLYRVPGGWRTFLFLAANC